MRISFKGFLFHALLACGCVFSFCESLVAICKITALNLGLERLLLAKTQIEGKKFHF